MKGKNLRDHFDQIFKFASTYQGIWWEEILQRHPTQGLTPFPEDWVKTLCELSEQEYFQVEGNKDFSPIANSEYLNFLHNLRKLTLLPQTNLNSQTIDGNARFKLRGKKLHELSQLKPILNEYYKNHQCDQVVDMGGGIGHLALVCCHQLKIPSLSIDQDWKLQNKGVIRHIKYAPTNSAPIHYLRCKVDDTKKIRQISEKSLVVGLHSCGSLSSDLLKLAIKNKSKAIINFGCCYYRMNKEHDYNHSQYAQKNGFKTLSKEALALATRPSGKISIKSFRIKQIVKEYRYCLRILLNKIYGYENTVSVGNTHPRDYFAWKFSEYAQEQLNRLNLEQKLSSKQLDEFHHDHLKLLKQWIRANTIRNDLGRVIEHYILTDRCLYLEENGHAAEMIECFDVNLSPRNIGIFSHRI